ncbi:hypothetical protein BpHYR1_051235 [Brachionus plicatilis]|uniref:Uncharacterized protein n=1 Tax=Brachionus plicatilis TaxID=10195 RepID=A0A3M7RN25_BRAPC|nr:hypothetical protein BpHYR1_051235 [Brachionus plicatilis]
MELSLFQSKPINILKIIKELKWTFFVQISGTILRELSNRFSYKFKFNNIKIKQIILLTIKNEAFSKFKDAKDTFKF